MVIPLGSFALVAEAKTCSACFLQYFKSYANSKLVDVN